MATSKSGSAVHALIVVLISACAAGGGGLYGLAYAVESLAGQPGEEPWIAPVFTAHKAAPPEDPQLVLAARYGQRDSVNLLLDQGVVIDSRDRLGRTALIAAAGEMDSGMVDLLIRRGADVSAADSDGATALMHASFKGHLDNVRLLLDAGADIDTHDRNGETALIAAVRFNQARLVGYLLTRGADPNRHDAAGYTPLMRAVARDIPPQDGFILALALLARGAEPNIARGNGETALSAARHNGHHGVADELVRLGARDETPYAGLSMENALLKAVKLGDMDKAAALLGDSADPDYRDPVSGVTPLSSAAHRDDARMLDLLIRHGADINNVPWGLSEQRIEASSVTVGERDLMRVAARGDTALLTSIRRGDLAAVRTLLDNGADVYLPNRAGETPGIIAASQGEDEIMRALLAQGLDPNKNDPPLASGYMISNLVNNGIPPALLTVAAMSGHAAVTGTLLEAGAHADARDRRGRTALFQAVTAGHAPAVVTLLEHGANADIGDLSGTTPLMVAAQHGHESIARALLDHEAEVNVIGGLLAEARSDGDGGGMSALMYAARGGHASIVEMLLKRGANVRLRADNGEKAVDTAQRGGHEEVVKLLTAATAD